MHIQFIDFQESFRMDKEVQILTKLQIPSLMITRHCFQSTLTINLLLRWNRAGANPDCRHANHRNFLQPVPEENPKGSTLTWI